MSRSAREEPEGRCCSAREIFELCEGSLEPARRGSVRSHLRSCSSCRNVYEREASLSGALSSPEQGSAGARQGTSRRVTMALPTRSPAARIVWGAGAAALLIAALVSLALQSSRPVSLVTDFMTACWGITSGFADAAGILLAVSGSTILAALVVGALVDVLIAATLLALARWRRPRGA